MDFDIKKPSLCDGNFMFHIFRVYFNLSRYISGTLDIGFVNNPGNENNRLSKAETPPTFISDFTLFAGVKMSIGHP
jgi:hypothetical protein